MIFFIVLDPTQAIKLSIPQIIVNLVLSGDTENVDFSTNMATNVNICTQSPVKNDEDDEEESPVVYKKPKNNNGSFYNSAIGRFDQR